MFVLTRGYIGESAFARGNSEILAIPAASLTDAAVRLPTPK